MLKLESQVNSPPLGAKVWVPDKKRSFTVRARDDRFAICTQPFNARKTVLYFILDVQRAERGPENLIFGMGAETDEQCREMLDRLTAGESEVSYRHCVPWDVVRVEAPRP